ncbi:MAG TPA: methylated-DNA--[protein]-cysteine S-methyltransferase, partial [Actinopolymorphaceae bacterium]
MSDTVLTTVLTTPIGPLRLVAEAGALTRVDFLDEPTARSDVPPSDPTLVAAVTQLTEYFAGDRTAFDLPLAPAGTPFQQKVWAALTRIPYGSTWTYGRLALEVGVPTAARAVGAANGRNPLAVVVPCHRVIGS